MVHHHFLSHHPRNRLHSPTSERINKRPCAFTANAQNKDPRPLVRSLLVVRRKVPNFGRYNVKDVELCWTINPYRSRQRKYIADIERSK